jgi:hypothetical protein
LCPPDGVRFKPVSAILREMQRAQLERERASLARMAAHMDAGRERADELFRNGAAALERERRERATRRGA